MKKLIRTTTSLPIIIIGLCLGMMTGCHAGLDGPVLETEGFHIGDLLRPPADPADAGEEAPGRDEEERGGDATPVGRGPIVTELEGDPGVPIVAEPRGESLVKIRAFTCKTRPDDELCQVNDILDASRAVVVSWELTNVKAAFMNLPALSRDNADRFQYTPFIGDDNQPYIGLQSGAADVDKPTFAADLLSDPLAGFDALSREIQDNITGDAEALPFSHCVTKNAIDPRRLCFDGDERMIPPKQIILFPLRAGETSRTGRWLLPINGEEQSLYIGYTDPVGVVHTEKVIISRVLDLGDGIPQNVVNADEGLQRPVGHVDAPGYQPLPNLDANFRNAGQAGLNDGSGTRINVGIRPQMGTIRLHPAPVPNNDRTSWPYQGEPIHPENTPAFSR